ncbi:MAG TPA: DUF3604 domain-containing protein [Candidatus Binatia bacterium]|nr:DUF3604 domain-containing protein [Candidatus Binatia bacterium]
MTLRAGRVPLLAVALTACSDGEVQVTPGLPATPGAHVQCAHFQPQRQPFFGDLHVHTTYSLDANTQGTIVGPHDSYRFARGERLGIQPYDADGQPTRFTQLRRPLDFAAVTDHSEFFGETRMCTHPEEPGYDSPECEFYRERPDQAFIFFNLLGPGMTGIPTADGGETIPRLPFCGVDGSACLTAAKTPWRDVQQAAEAYYDRSRQCRFTTFVGYEWTGSPQSNNLHRNVIFASESVPELPTSYYEAPEPELLWQALSDACRSAAGCNVLTIPHNSNLSAGLMFQTQDRNGDDFTAEYAAARQANEPLAEITQHKGQSECLGTTGAGAADELCNFEVLPYNNLTGDRFGGLNTGPPKEQDFLRSALKQGLAQEQALGVNPFKYGFIGSTDTHLGTPGNASESGFPGHAGAGMNPRDSVTGLTDVIEVNPGGLAVLWAEQNTRESLFAAMRRREAYGTSGTRPVVRFFGGWDVPASLCSRNDFAAQGYATGVPMGGDLPARSGAGAPRFAVSALRDAGTAGEPVEPLQRIQIVKGWIEDGVQKEKVYEVAGNPANGASVDTGTCETSGPGFAQLCAVWQDPQFDAAQPAFWYARVVENPSCRWATRQCVAAHVDCAAGAPAGFEGCCDAAYPKTVQERAWTSPIWYRPAS